MANHQVLAHNAEALVAHGIANYITNQKARQFEASLSFAPWVKHQFDEDLWDMEIQIAEAVEKKFEQGGGYVAVRGCHASGKSWTAARVALRILTRWSDANVILTGPKFNQIKDNLFKYVVQAAEKGKGWPTAGADTLAISRFNTVSVINSSRGVNMQGYHGRILIIVDEAPGVIETLYEAFRGIAAGGQVVILLLGNPTVTGGSFYDAWAKPGTYTTFTIDALETPNLVGLGANPEERIEALRSMKDDDDRLDDDLDPNITKRRWVYDCLRDWGVDSPMWEARVRGQFPTQSNDALINMTWLTYAEKAEWADDGGPVICGLDVAGPGKNETVLYSRTGPVILNGGNPMVWNKSDPTGEVMLALDLWGDRLIAVNVDADGLGYHLGMNLRRQGYPIHLIRAELDSNKPKLYANYKAEMWFSFRNLLQGRNVVNLTDMTTQHQLLTVKWETPKGRLGIESKDKRKARALPSPDRADALVYCFASNVPVGGDDKRKTGEATPQPFSETRTRKDADDRVIGRSPI